MGMITLKYRARSCANCLAISSYGDGCILGYEVKNIKKGVTHYTGKYSSDVIFIAPAEPCSKPKTRKEYLDDYHSDGFRLRWNRYKPTNHDI